MPVPSGWTSANVLAVIAFYNQAFFCHECLGYGFHTCVSIDALLKMPASIKPYHDKN